MNPSRFNTLDATLASVPREVQPGHDLWPGVARIIGHGAQGVPQALWSRWPLALAASLGVLSLVGALCWSVVHERVTAELLAGRAPAGDMHSIAVSFQRPQDADYVAARTALERTFNERLALLAPATRDRIRADLETIRKANADISSALAQDPASPLLWQLLRSTWQQEIDLYTTVAQTTRTMLTRRT